VSWVTGRGDVVVTAPSRLFREAKYGFGEAHIGGYDGG
jgi:hypothetical protein